MYMFGSFYINSYLKNRTKSKNTEKDSESEISETPVTETKQISTPTKTQSTSNFFRNLINILSKNSQFDLHSGMSESQDILLDEKKFI